MIEIPFEVRLNESKKLLVDVVRHIHDNNKISYQIIEIMLDNIMLQVKQESTNELQSAVDKYNKALKEEQEKFKEEVEETEKDE